VSYSSRSQHSYFSLKQEAISTPNAHKLALTLATKRDKMAVAINQASLAVFRECFRNGCKTLTAHASSNS
jgi:hypothetical protein